MTVCVGEPYFAHAMAVCACLHFQAIAAISLDARWPPGDLAAVGVRDADLAFDPVLSRSAKLGHVEAQFSLGALCASGAVDKDDHEPLCWYQKVAEPSQPEAARQVVKYLRLDMPDHRKTHAADQINEEVCLLNIAAWDGRSEVRHLQGTLRYERGDWKRGGLFACYTGFLLIKRAAVLAHRPGMGRLAAIHVCEGIALLGAGWHPVLAQAAFLEDPVEDACTPMGRSSGRMMWARATAPSWH